MGCSKYLDDAEKLLNEIISEGGIDFIVCRTPDAATLGKDHEALTVHRSTEDVAQSKDGALLTTWQYHVYKDFYVYIKTPGLSMQIPCEAENDPLGSLECVFFNYCSKYF